MSEERSEKQYKGKPRASASGRWIPCPASLVEEDKERAFAERVAGPGADMGTRVHEILAVVVKGLTSPADAIRLAYSEDDRLGQLVRTGCRMWESLHVHFPQPIVEGVVENTRFPEIGDGHCDVLDVSQDFAIVLDWKSGYQELETDRQQCKSYLSLAFDRTKHKHGFYIIAYLNGGDHVTERVTSEEIEQHRAGMQAAVKDVTIYRSGAHCLYCAAAHRCEANLRELQGASTALLAKPGDELSPIAQVRMLPRVRQLKRMIEQYELGVKAFILSKGEMIKLANGNSAKILPDVTLDDGSYPGITFSHTRSVVMPDALDTVVTMLREKGVFANDTDRRNAVLSTVTGSISKLEALVASVAPVRQGAAYKRDLGLRLTADDALNMMPKQSLGSVKESQIKED